MVENNHNFPKQFICAGSEYSTFEKYIPAPYFRKNFIIDNFVDSAEIVITGLGYYELYLNGENITKGLLAPYRSNPDDIVYYDKYNIIKKLKKGKNVVGVILGNGIQNALGGFVWNFDKAKFRSSPKTAFSIYIKFTDGNNQTIISDTSVKTAQSPIIFDDLNFGEYYDARKEIQDWNLPEYDDSNWLTAEFAETPMGEARYCTAEPIVVREEIKPVSITKQGDSFLYDFGVNSSGVCRLKIDGNPGQKILLQYGEFIKDGRLCLANIRFKPEDRFQEDEYYCKGCKGEQYTPRFTYHGFRYVLVTGITDDQAKEDLLTYLIISSDLVKNADFFCSNDIVNKIQAATVRSDISNFYYFPTDCPQREKNGWTADAALSSEQLLINLKPENSFEEWMRNIYKAMSDEGKIPGIIPTTGWGYDRVNGPAWDNVIVYIPYYTYIYRGNRKIIEEASVPLMRYLKYLYSRLDNNGLIAIGLGDWCTPGRNQSDYIAPLIVTDSILTADIARKSAFIFGELGQNEQKEFAEKFATRVRDAIRKHLIDMQNMTVYGECQTCQSMAIYYGMFEEAEKTLAFQKLLKYIDDADGHFNTGVLGGRVIFRVLADNGQAELAYNMITRPDYPSYGNWIKRGATTLFEAFYPEGGKVLSLNHHFWGDVSAWFYRYLAGIDINPNKEDTENIDIKPCFISDLSFVNANVDTPHGALMVKWNRKNSLIYMTIEAPKCAYGKICLPAGYKFENGNDQITMRSGNYIIVKTEERL